MNYLPHLMTVPQEDDGVHEVKITLFNANSGDDS
jgi:hypothetical protein